MIRVAHLHVEAFRGWLEPVDVDLDRPITAIVGANRRGKSSLTGAIEWCLFGSVVAKKSPGLEERVGWEIAARGAGNRPTVVSLRLADADGTWHLTRTLAPSAKARDDGEVVLLLPDGSRHAGHDAIGELRAAGLPDWETWRRAHGFHQEAARTRVVDTKDRSHVLGALLGLAEDIRVREAVEAARPGALIKAVDEVAARTEEDVEERLVNPGRELAEVEERLVARGVDRTTLGADRLAEERARLVSDARELAEQLELEVDLPDPRDPGAVRAWAATWLEAARGSSPALRRLDALRTTYAELREALDGAKRARGALQAMEAKQAGTAKEGGDLDARRKAHDDAVAAREDAEKVLRRTHRAAALLTEARALVPEDDDAEAPCPVCATPVKGLVSRIDRALEALGSEAAAAAATALEEARRREEAARQAVRAAEDGARDLEEARTRFARSRGALAERLEADPDDDRDLVAAGNARLEALKEEGQALGRLEKVRDAGATAHIDHVDLLRLLEAWERTAARAERIVEVDTLPSWAVLQAGLDDAAAHAADLEALGVMAREVQEARSAARTQVVNDALGRYYELITGAEPSRDVRVDVKRTAKRITYELCDASGKPAVGVLNQAALNALSLAMLFAQAEERARNGGLAWVVLDDPIQSLDETRQAGLAKALEVLSESCQVLVAAVPSPFVTRLEEYVATPRRFVTLGPWTAAGGATLEEVRDR